MALRLRDLTLGYDRHPAVHHLDLELPAGSLTAIVGPNGAGKSTLLKGVMGELPPLEGRIELGATRLAYLPQLSEVDRSFPLSVQAIVAMGLWHRTGAFGGLSRSDLARVGEALAAVGLTGFERRPISALSGGQVQRVMFARLFLEDAGLILHGEASFAAPFVAGLGLTMRPDHAPRPDRPLPCHQRFPRGQPRRPSGRGRHHPPRRCRHPGAGRWRHRRNGSASVAGVPRPFPFLHGALILTGKPYVAVDCRTAADQAGRGLWAQWGAG
jgi:ABC-type transport system involved in cytochrome c biogenesis ATPase subunit